VTYPQEYDGGAVMIPAPDIRSTAFSYSLFDYYAPIVWPKLGSIITARDRGEDPFASLTPSQADALNQLYDAGQPRGGEFAWTLAGPSLISFGLTLPMLVLCDQTYLNDFWSKPGYEGHDGLVTSEIIEGITGTVTAIGAPNSNGNILSFTDASKAFLVNQVSGYSVIFTSGSLKGGSFRIHVGSNTANTVNILGEEGALNGIAPGDTYVMNNRDLLAWQNYHRHLVQCDLPEYKNFCSNGKPIYVQRPKPVQNAYSLKKAGLSGQISAPVVLIASELDQFGWPTYTNNYIEGVRSKLGNRADEMLRVYWMENGAHGWTSPNRSVYGGFPLEFLTRWVEEGIAPPPDTVVSITPGTMVFPPTADKRKGIQPTVSDLTANGTLNRVTVPVNTPVYFNGVAWSPIGKIAQYQWDFESNNAYDCTSGGCGGGAFIPAQVVEIPAVHTYNTPGTFVATVLVTDDTVGGFQSTIRNLGRVVVDVLP
jgi:hypothetical protein